jgi:hypothetical protein
MALFQKSVLQEYIKLQDVAMVDEAYGKFCAHFHNAKMQTEIDKTDREIDRMVYALYGLTEEEIKIVEEGV